LDRYNTIVVGSGIAGLTTALILKKHGLKVVILEKEQFTGGNIRSITGDNYILETGPHSFMGSSEFIWELIKELELEEQAEPALPASRNRYIYRHDKLKPLPMGFVSFITSTLLSPLSKIRLMLEPFIPNRAKEEDTAWDFFCRRFGKEAATYIMSPFISGVYAGDVKRLGAKAAFSKFWKFEKESGSMIMGAFKYMKDKKQRYKKEGKELRSGLFSFRSGLGTITSVLAEKLKEEIKFGVAITDISRKNGRYLIRGNKDQEWEASSIVFACPPNESSELIKNNLPETAELFKKIPMSPVVTIHWKVKDENNELPDGFGFLMPRNSGLRVLGTLFPSKLFNGRIGKKSQLFASFYGGMTDPDLLELSDKEIVKILLDEHKKIFKKDLSSAKILKIIRYENAIPQLTPSHPGIIKKIKDDMKEKMPGVYIAGNYLTGVGIENAVESGYSAANLVLKDLVIKN